jgi:nitrate reductase delta subunit
MTEFTEVCDSLARILTYPGVDYADHLQRCRIAVGALGPDRGEILQKIDKFIDAMKDSSTGEMEELYTRTFDINPVSSLEVGWHLHGETYERGAFLVSMREVLRRCSIEESTELPDHLTHVLQAVGRMDPLEASEFIKKNVLKAVNKMLEGFLGQSSPYENILLAVKELLSLYATSHVGV